MHPGFFYSSAGYAGIRDAQREASHAAGDAQRARSESARLEARLERLALMTEALWLLLRDRFDVSEEELIEYARRLDLSDGHLDGRKRRTSQPCPGCERMVGAHHPVCLYCGTEMPRGPFEGT